MKGWRTKENALILAFSGGGTRPAALSYGVLKELRDTPIVFEGQTKRLLDGVNTISSVSGGSFTSAYYGLRGDGIFDDFEDVFLRQNSAVPVLFNPVVVENYSECGTEVPDWLKAARNRATDDPQMTMVVRDLETYFDRDKRQLEAPHR